MLLSQMASSETRSSRLSMRRLRHWRRRTPISISTMLTQLAWRGVAELDASLWADIRRRDSEATRRAHARLSAASCRLIGRWRIFEATSGIALTLTSVARRRSRSPRKTGNHLRRHGGRPRSRIRPRLDRLQRGRIRRRRPGRGRRNRELLDDGTIEIEFTYNNGDKATLKAKRDPSSTAAREERWASSAQ